MMAILKFLLIIFTLLILISIVLEKEKKNIDIIVFGIFSLYLLYLLCV